MNEPVKEWHAVPIDPQSKLLIDERKLGLSQEYYWHIKVWCRRNVAEHQQVSSGRKKCVLGVLLYDRKTFFRDIRMSDLEDSPVSFDEFSYRFETGLSDAELAKNTDSELDSEIELAFEKSLELEYGYHVPIWRWYDETKYNDIEYVRKYVSIDSLADAYWQRIMHESKGILDRPKTVECAVCRTEYDLDLHNQDVLALLKRKAVEGQRRTNIAELMRAQYKVPELRRMFPNGDYPREILEAHPLMPELLAR